MHHVIYYHDWETSAGIDIYGGPQVSTYRDEKYESVSTLCVSVCSCTAIQITQLLQRN
jgi:hypothetical protein